MYPPTWMVQLPGFGPIVANVFRWIALSTQPRYSIVRRRGILFVADLKSIIGRHMYSRGFWEADLVDFLAAESRLARSTLKSECWFIDIGANTGLYSVYFAKHGKPDRTLAFEPECQNLIELNFNLHINDVENVEVHGIGLSDQEGTADLYNANSKGRSTLEPSATVSDVQQVRIAKFDRLFQPTGKFLIVKMDIEGHELHAAIGMKDALSNNSALLQIEAHSDNLSELEAFLQSVGYKRFHSIGFDHYFKNF